MNEVELNLRIEHWRHYDEEAKTAASEADKFKQEMLDGMHELGLKIQESPLGRVTLSPTKKCNIVVDRKVFEETLKKKGVYDAFCSTKFDMDKVKNHVETEGDDLYGMVEVETNYAVRFTPAKESL